MVPAHPRGTRVRRRSWRHEVLSGRTHQWVATAVGMTTGVAPLPAAAFRTVIGLMATTGLRLGEALALDRQDVDLTDGALHVRAREHKQREVPLHRTATRALRDYARFRDRRWPAPPSSAFFLNLRGDRLSNAEFNHTFAKLIREVGLEGAGERVRPRPHDLRHTMAVRTLLDWIAAGEDVDRRMPELSTFLGHYAGDRVKCDRLVGRRARRRGSGRSIPRPVVVSRRSGSAPSGSGR